MIVRSSPDNEKDLATAEAAWFDSDAADNIAAIKEIDAEAAKYGLIRAQEYWLRTLLFNGQLVRRGVCSRLNLAEVPNISSRMAEARRNDVVGVSSAQIVREMRNE